MKSLSNKTQQIALVILLLIQVILMAMYQSASVGSGAIVSTAPSKLDGVGTAVTRVGEDTSEGPDITARCVTCHGELGIANIQPFTAAGTTLLILHPADAEASLFASNLALSIEHGFTSGGPGPALHRLPDSAAQNPNDQNIRAVLAYLVRLKQK